MNLDSLIPLNFASLFQGIPDLIPLVSVTGTVVLLNVLVRFFLLRFALPRLKSQHSRIQWRRNSLYIIVAVSLTVIFPLWLPSLRSVVAILGIFGAGVLLVLKEVILNLAGWFYIITRKPFDIGNRIQISAFSGDVIDVRLLEFTLMEVRTWAEGGQSTGRVLHVPNLLVFTNPLANSSKEFAFNWNELTIPLEPGSDWRKAVKIIEEVAGKTLETISSEDSRIRRSEEEYAIRFYKMTPRVYMEFKNGAIVLTLRHLAEPKSCRHISDRLWRDILTRFDREKKIILSTNMQQFG